MDKEDQHVHKDHKMLGDRNKMLLITSKGQDLDIKLPIHND